MSGIPRRWRRPPVELGKGLPKGFGFAVGRVEDGQYLADADGRWHRLVRGRADREALDGIDGIEQTHQRRPVDRDEATVQGAMWREAERHERAAGSCAVQLSVTSPRGRCREAIQPAD